MSRVIVESTGVNGLNALEAAPQQSAASCSDYINHSHPYRTSDEPDVNEQHKNKKNFLGALVLKGFFIFCGLAQCLNIIRQLVVLPLIFTTLSQENNTM